MTTMTVYRFFDATGAAIYVGCTGDMRRRMLSHRTKEWWTSVATAEFTHVTGSEEAFALEAAEVRRLRPKHNVSNGDPSGTRLLTQLAFARGLRIGALAQRTGLSRQTLYNIEDGQKPSLVTIFKLAPVLGLTADELVKVLGFTEGEKAAA